MSYEQGNGDCRNGHRHRMTNPSKRISRPRKLPCKCYQHPTPTLLPTIPLLLFSTLYPFPFPPSPCPPLLSIPFPPGYPAQRHSLQHHLTKPSAATRSPALSSAATSTLSGLSTSGWASSWCTASRAVAIVYAGVQAEESRSRQISPVYFPRGGISKFLVFARG